ncbi:hypothetical protein [Paenibacillus terrae]|uniref:Uncharacterized protein n=1 Tax=Paenibacillus terrae TaxID=159743 RepID=A0A0D7WW21_9BACL|nr:hypothetical protein [Paenibacillus terrae]KJD43386.1 hypothetical protein QD47_23070 [Paenibacillus terrae]
MGTPVPNRKNETASRGQSDVKTYTLSPEELAEIVGKPIPKSHIKPLSFRAKTPTIKEEKPTMAKATKNDYLKLRAEALSRPDAAKKLGITPSSLNAYWLPKWGIRSVEAEEVEIARYKESIKAEPKDEPKPAAPAQVAEIVADTQPVTQPEDGLYKPVLTKAEDEGIKWLLTEWDKQSLLHEHAAAPNGWQIGTQAEALNGMSVWLLAQALITGYEVELTTEETLLAIYQDSYIIKSEHNNGWRAGVRWVLSILGKEIEGINAGSVSEEV